MVFFGAIVNENKTIVNDTAAMVMSHWSFRPRVVDIGFYFAW
jgi:hypothetical protein